MWWAYVLFTLSFLLLQARSNYEGDSLFALKKSLNASSSQLADWNQNMVTPCDWTSVTCTNNEVVKVTLTSMGLSGTLKAAVGGLRSLSIFSVQDNDISGGIPNEFGNLSDLTKLDLSENQLTGEIPRSLGNLAKLQYLLLSENNLEGSIPDSLTNISTLFEIQLAFNNLTGVIPNRLFQVPQYNFTGNKLNCGLGHSNPCESALQDSGKKEKSVTGVAFGSIGAVLGCVILGGIIFIWWKGRRKVYRPEVFVDVSGEDGRRITFGQLKRFAWRELQLATDNFNERNVLGQGGFGKVYKGVLTDNTRIAVKRLTDHQSAGGAAAFLREVELISVAVHRKLLRLIGFCITPSERLLVYPFMQNLSVASRLREIKPGEEILDWPTRKRIALGTARGLEYLHEHCNPKIIHRDVKAANVLLNEEFEAVVGDFGLAKLVDLKQTDVTTQVRGTMGHIAPEYLSTGKSSERTDVFGYGITLLELVTGKRAIELSRLEEEEDVLLLDHVKKLEREKRLYTIVDPNLKQNYDGQGVEMMIQVALLCTQASPEDRPKMPEVVLMLERQDLAEMWLQWQQVEHTRRQEYERMQQRFDWEQNSVYNQEAIELSGAR